MGGASPSSSTVFAIGAQAMYRRPGAFHVPCSPGIPHPLWTPTNQHVLHHRLPTLLGSIPAGATLGDCEAVIQDALLHVASNGGLEAHVDVLVAHIGDVSAVPSSKIEKQVLHLRQGTISHQKRLGTALPTKHLIQNHAMGTCIVYNEDCWTFNFFQTSSHV